MPELVATEAKGGQVSMVHQLQEVMVAMAAMAALLLKPRLELEYSYMNRHHLL